MRILIFCIALALAACSAPPKPQDPVKTYQMTGEVLSIDLKDHIAKIKHDKIEGWMGAMTMDYPVKDDAELSKLSSGEKISATVYVQGTDYWVGQFHETK